MDCRFLAATFALSLGISSARAQFIISPPTPLNPPQTAPATPPATAPATGPATHMAIPDADRILQDLIQNPTTPGAAGTPTVRVPAAIGPETTGLIQEGMLIFNFAGRLEKDAASGDVRFIFDKEQKTATGTRPGYAPMGVVPSRRLMLMEDAQASAPSAPTFRINAEVTQYRGKNFLYIKEENSDARNSTTKPKPSDDLIPAIPAVAPNEPRAIRLREFDTITARTARLIKDPKSGQSVIAFDSDGKDMKDPPMVAIPGRWLAMMEDASEQGVKPVKFRISGDVTSYRGSNYFYVRAAQIVRDLNQGIGAGAPVHFDNPTPPPVITTAPANR